MRWDFVIEFWTARLLADAALESVMGYAGFIYPAGANRPVKVPSIEYSMFSDVETELFNPILLQVDLWATGIKKAAQIERRIGLVTHWDYGQELGGERLWLRQTDARDGQYDGPEKGTIHRILDFRFEPIREKYATL